MTTRGTKGVAAPVTIYAVILQKYGVILLKGEKPNKPCEVLAGSSIEFGWVGGKFFHNRHEN